MSKRDGVLSTSDYELSVTPFLRTAYNYDRDAVSDETGLRCEDESLAKQSFAEECDINTIVKRFRISGELPTGVVAPVYADYEDIFDFHSAMNAIAKAHEAFDAMPAEVRTRFQNDPAAFVAFCSDGANRDEAEKLGLVFKKPDPVVPAPMRVEVVAGARPGDQAEAPAVAPVAPAQ